VIEDADLEGALHEEVDSGRDRNRVDHRPERGVGRDDLCVDRGHETRSDMTLRGDAQWTARDVLLVLRDDLDRLEQAHDLERTRVDLLPHLRQRDAALSANEELDAELVFEEAHRTTDGGLLHVDRPRRLRKAAGARDLVEVAEVRRLDHSKNVSCRFEHSTLRNDSERYGEGPAREVLMKRARLSSPCFGLLLLVVSCSSDPTIESASPAGPPEAPSLPPTAEKPPPAASAPSFEDRAALRFLNNTPAAALVARGFSEGGAQSITDRRRGPDRVLGTADDDVFVVPEDIEKLALVADDRVRLAAIAADEPPPDNACSAGAPRLVRAELYVTPDQGDEPVIARIDAAKKSIDVVMYTLSSYRIRDALIRAAGRGVAVRIILDRAHDDVDERVASFISAGVAARASSKRFSYTHQKSLVLDGRMLFVFTGNFDRQTFASGRNFGAYVRDPEDIWDAEDLFDADWNDQDIDLSCTRLVIAPDNAQGRIVDLIDSATTRIEVEALYASDLYVQNALIAAKGRGVAVRILFNDPRFGVGDATDEAERLSAAGVVVRRSPQRFIHAKLVVVDGQKAFLGSENFSTNSVKRNRELGVVLTKDEIDVAGVVDVFEKDFAAGVAFGTTP
jgi:cardiolipin synthase A/B